MAKTLCSPCRGPGQGNRSHMLQLSLHVATEKICHAATQAWCNQINTKKIKKRKNNKCRQGCGKVGTFGHCFWECKMVLCLVIPQKVKQRQYDLVFLGPYPEELKAGAPIFTPVC